MAASRSKNQHPQPVAGLTASLLCALAVACGGKALYTTDPRPNGDGSGESAAGRGANADAGIDPKPSKRSVSYWEHGELGDDPRKVGVDANENVYVAGNAHSTVTGAPSSTLDVYIRKYGEQGNPRFIRRWGEPDVDDWMQDLAVEPSGNFYVARRTFEANSKSALEKYDPNANLLWSQPVRLAISAITLDEDNNLFAAATDAWDPSGGAALTLEKYDSSGSLQWSSAFDTRVGPWIPDLAIDSAGNAYVVCNIDRSSVVDKLDAQHHLLWTLDLGLAADSEVWGIAIDSSGNIYVAGATPAAPGAANAAFIRKYDANRNLSWTQQLGAETASAARSVRLDVLGNPYLAGHTAVSLVGPPLAASNQLVGFIRKYDPNGTTQWTEQCVGNNLCDILSIAIAQSGNVYAAASRDQQPLVLKIAVH